MSDNPLSDIKVRKLDFGFPDDVPVIAIEDDFFRSMQLLGFSFTLPYLEPYLIRTMRTAVREVKDPALAQDMKDFSSQEGYHFRNHAQINDIIRAKLTPSTATRVKAIEDRMEADYQKFTRERDVKFNLAYAEGFEAMTLVMAIDSYERGFDGFDPNWAQLWEWHLAEEVEHRTVCFDAYDRLYGDYLYRVKWGAWAQKHFLDYVERFAKAIAVDFEATHGAYETVLPSSKVRRRLLSGYTPWYNPRKIPLPEGIAHSLAKFDQQAA